MDDLEILDNNIKGLREILARVQEEFTNAKWYSLILNNGLSTLCTDSLKQTNVLKIQWYLL